MEIKICTSNEIEELAILANEIWHEYFIQIISNEQIDYMVDMFQSKNALVKAMEDGYIYFLAYENNTLIGYCGIHPEEEKVFLSKLYLHKDYRGRGLSSFLLKEAINYGKQNSKKAMYLTCNKNNDNSLGVYYAKGFYKIDDVKTDIGNGFIMDDYVLQLDINV